MVKRNTVKIVSKETWLNEVEKFKQACNELGRQIKVNELTHHFMDLKCAEWYWKNAPEELGLSKYSDFIKYIGANDTNKAFYRNRLSKEETIVYVKNLKERLGRNIKMSDFPKDTDKVSKADIYYYFGSLNNLNKELGWEETVTYKGHSYSENELIALIKDFITKQGFIPDSQFVEKHGKEYGLPNRKTFTNKFGSWKNVLSACGFEDEKFIEKNGKYVLKHDNKDFLTDLVLGYVEEFDKVPTLKEINEYYGTSLSKYFEKHFGSWRSCLDYLSLEQNSIGHYTDEELDNAFLDFVKEFGRVPSIRDFNNTGRPSFWCYQNRYGSWAEACINYGFEPNYRKPQYYMDDGERCDSRFEYDISTWLKSRGITYDRDIPYIEFTNNYNGKMNCDYRFVLDNGQIWYVEMAGFINTDDFTKLTSREEELYYFKLKYKKKLFRENNLNYVIIHPSDLKNKTMEEIFHFLKIKKAS